MKETINQDYSDGNNTEEANTKLFNEMFSVDKLQETGSDSGTIKEDHPLDVLSENEQTTYDNLSEETAFDDILGHKKFEEAHFSRSVKDGTPDKTRLEEVGTDYSHNKMFKFQSEYVWLCDE